MSYCIAGNKPLRINEPTRDEVTGHRTAERLVMVENVIRMRKPINASEIFVQELGGTDHVRDGGLGPLQEDNNKMKSKGF